MNENARAAFVFSMSVRLYADIEMMKAANEDRSARGLAQAYGEEHFVDTIKEYNSATGFAAFNF